MKEYPISFIRELKPQLSIEFSRNWNNKLANNIFYTTIRRDSEKYKVGEFYNVLINGALDHKAQLVYKAHFLLDKLPEITAYLDTGMNSYKAKAMLRKMYANKMDLKTEPLCILLLKNLESQQIK